MSALGQNPRVISADSHVTEPFDLWTSYLEPEYKERAPHVEHRPETDVWILDGAQLEWPVGSLHGARFKRGAIPTHGRYSDIPPSGWNPESRLPEIEADGVYAEVLYPTITLRFFALSDGSYAQACVRAYNTWAADFGKGYPQRFKCLGLSMLDDIKAAVAELGRMKRLGLAGTMIAVHPGDAKPYYDHSYEPFWAAAQDLGMPISMHILSGRTAWRSGQETPEERFFTYTAVQRVLVGMIYAGTFDRFTKLQMVSAENDAGWAGNLLERMDYLQEKARYTRKAAGQNNKEAPSHYWRSNVSYTFMRDDTAIAARHIIGVERLMWASDYPHPDSTWPDSQTVISKQLQGVPAPEQHMILHDNAQALYGF